MVVKLKNLIILFLKGIFIGGSMTVPGVSGGSIAIIFGIYNSLIDAVADFFKHKLKSAILLLTVGLGGVVGILILSRPISSLLKTNPYETSFFFFGAVIGSLPMLFKRAEFKINIKDFAFVIMGLFIVVALDLLPRLNSINNTFVFIIAGFVGSIALILPGVSLSYFLLVLGVYESVINAINDFNLGVLIPFFISMVLGSFCFSKLISNALNKHPKFSFLSIIGFLLGSLTLLFPGIPPINNVLPSIFSFLVGAYVIYLIGKVKI